MLTYEEAYEEEMKRHRERIKLLRGYRNLFEIATMYAEKFSDRHKPDGNNYNKTHKLRRSSLTYSQELGSIEALGLDLHLGEKDSIIKNVGWIVEELKSRPDLKFIKDHDYLDFKWKGWEFRAVTNNKATLLIRAWFEHSTKCELRPTGETKEIMEVVCQE